MLDADDSTSFTSSLATSASEPEDLFLGVEAYSFKNSNTYIKKEPVEQKKNQIGKTIKSQYHFIQIILDLKF